MEAGGLNPASGQDSLYSSGGLSLGIFQNADPQGREGSSVWAEERKSLTSEWFLLVP